MFAPHKNNREIDWWKVIFVIFVAGYAVLMIVSPNLSPADDYLFLRTIQSGRPLLYYTNPPPGFPIGDFTKFGRFTPLGTMAYNFFGLFFKSPPVFWYYFFHAFQYVILMTLFVKILSKITSNKYLIYLPPIFLSLTPSAVSWFRTQIADRDTIFYYAIFLFFYLLYLEKSKLYHLVFGLTAANMAIHYKENAFIALSVFVFFHLILTWKKSRLGMKIFDGLVILSSFAYLILYYFVVYKNLPPDRILWSTPVFNSLLIFIKNILNYSLFTDPVLIFILLPFTAWRIYKFLRRQLELHPVYDSMLIAGSMFVIGYFILNIYSPNYMLPAYIFALPPLIYFFTQAEQRTLFWKSTMAISGLLLIFNVIPTGIHNITYQKYLPLNFNKTLDFLIQDIDSRYPDKRANIFIDAINPNTGAGVYFIIGEFLQHKGLTWNRFDFKSSVATNDTVLENIENFKSYVPFTLFQNNKFFQISKGDYLIITADGSTTKNITPEYIQSLNKDYDLVFRTYSPLAVPNLNLKILAKYILSKRLSQEQKAKEGIMLNENLMQWPDYYVFIRK